MILLVFLASLASIIAFNLEPRIAILKKGFGDSYFGFSVSPHQILSSDRIESVLLVGAPLDHRRNSSRAHHRFQNSQEGLLWKCPFTSQNKDCVPIDNYGGRTSPAFENRGQWLGVVVNSQGPGKPF